MASCLLGIGQESSSCDNGNSDRDGTSKEEGVRLGKITRDDDAVSSCTEQLGSSDDMQLTQNDPLPMKGQSGEGHSSDADSDVFGFGCIQVTPPKAAETHGNDKQAMFSCNASHGKDIMPKSNAGERECVHSTIKSTFAETRSEALKKHKTIRWHRPPPPKSEFKGNYGRHEST